MNTVTIRRAGHASRMSRRWTRSARGPASSWMPDIISRLVSWVVLAGMLAACALTLAVLVMGVLGYRVIVIKSGSMTPTLGVGDVVLSHSVPADQVRVGDVVTFRSPAEQGALVTHRVTGFVSRGAIIGFVTKGDANTVPEKWSIAEKGHLGLAVGSVPYVGWWFEILQTGPGRSAIILLVCAGICVAAVPRIWAGA